MITELESQVAKIQLGPEKGAGTFVYINAEKLSLKDSESFLVMEILEDNAALHESCQNIALSVNAVIKRVFKKKTGSESFELAISQVNEELGKLASMGHTNWIDKLNCIIGVRSGQVFNIATAGKTAAYFLRGKELSDISCSSPVSHPLKTFENFAAGKLKIGDILILSTNQLFNHISIDRLKRLLLQENFLKSAAQIVELLKANLDTNVSFGCILALQTEIGAATEEQIDLEEYIDAAQPSRLPVWAKIRHFVISLFMPGKKISSLESIEKPSVKERLQSAARRLDNIAHKIKNVFFSLGKGLKYGKENFAPSSIKQFSPQKKFFFFSVIILFLAVILQVSTAVYLKNRKQTRNKILLALNQAKKSLNDAEAALLYKDEPAAKDYYLKSISFLGSIQKPDKNIASQIDEIQKESHDIKTKLEKTVEITAENLGTLAASDNLIKLPEYLAVQTNLSANNSDDNQTKQTKDNMVIVSLNKANLSIRDDALKFPVKIELIEYINKNMAAVYSGESLKIWDYSQGAIGKEFISSVPSRENAVGLKFYPTNSRVYMLDKNKNQIINFAILGEVLGKPVVAVNLETEDAKYAKDLAVDGSIYVLTGNNIKKYRSGQPAEFGPLPLLTPLLDAKKIITKNNFSNIYILDSGNKRIVVLNKKGRLVYTLVSQSFNEVKDFEVDETNNVIYVLNGSSLLKLKMP